MASSLDSMGHFTKTVADSALTLSITAGNDPHDATSFPDQPDDYMSFLNREVKGLTLGLPQEYFGEGIDPRISSLVKDSALVLEGRGANIVEVSLPNTSAALAAYYIICPSELSANLARFDGIRFGKKRDQFGAEAKRRIMLGTYALSSGYYDAYYRQAQAVRSLIVADFDKAFSQVDALIAPISPTLPFNLGEKANDPLAMYMADVLTCPVNLAGVPSLAIPCGFIDDLPVGLQIIGPSLSEGLLFQIGQAYEIETNFYHQLPKVAR